MLSQLQLIKGWEEGKLRFNMSCALVHPALIFEFSLPHMTLIYHEDEGRRFLWKIITRQGVIARKTVNLHCAVIRTSNLI
jgi:hypothetical protein